MQSSLANYPCPDCETANLRDRLVSLYQRLADIECGKRGFGGFIEPLELPKKFHMPIDVYPRLKLNFTANELEALIGYAALTAPELLAQASTPLERLLVAAVWKNGDLKKIHHIAEGLGYGLGRSVILNEKTKGPVFKQFGRHLAAPAEQPIADQHTLRAYRIHRDGAPQDKGHLTGCSSGDEIAKYVAWVQEISGNAGSRDRLHDFDKSMFALGSATKHVLKKGEKLAIAK